MLALAATVLLVVGVSLTLSAHASPAAPTTGGLATSAQSVPNGLYPLGHPVPNGLTIAEQSGTTDLQAAQRAAVGGLGSTSVIAQNGFGSTQNSYAWGMTWFKGKLYVGTGRDVNCVERETTDFYYPFSHSYSTHPEPGVHCPKNPYAMDLRAEIWQYTPKSGTWRMVYRAPVGIVNPRARKRHLHLSPDIAYRGMAVVRDPKGRQVLFVSGVSADEYVPQASIRQPPRLLRSYDGRHFHNISVPIIVHRTGAFPDHRAIGFRGIVTWRGGLYVLASTGLTGDGAVMRINHPWSKKASFTQVTPPWLYVFEVQTFDGNLYFGGGNGNTGYSVYKLSRKHRPFRLHPIVTRGAGRGHYMTSVVSMQVYRNHLYVGAVGWYCVTCNALPTTELIRIAPNGHWQVVAGAKRFVASESKTKYPISGLGDGFDNIFNSHLWRMAVSGNALYVGTLDWSWLLQRAKNVLNGYPGILSSVLAGELGFDIWASCDGRDFFPVTRDAFGVDEYDFGVRTLIGVNGGFYIGTANHAHGTRIFHQQSNICASFARPPRGVHRQAVTAAAATPEPPQDLLTDAQRQGTVLSWDRSAGATEYQVTRAAYVHIPYSFYKPVVFPDGFTDDDAVPIPAAPGSPHSASTTLTFPGTNRILATTTHPYFVDRTRRPGVKYSYQVTAVGASGARSIGSNIQVTPDPRPPATFSQLDALAPRSSASAVRAAARTHGCAGAVAALTRLAQTAGTSDEGVLADRLARRLQYRDLAGGPVTGGVSCG